MKAKFILGTIFLLGGIGVLRAQNSDNKNVVREDFEKNLFHWEEIHEKTCEGYIDMWENAYILQEKSTFALSTTRLPVDITRNFKIKMRFIVSKVNKKNLFGIVYNYKNLEENGDYTGVEKKKLAIAATFRTFLVADGRFQLCGGNQYVIGNRNASKFVLCFKDTDGTLILRSGKNKEVELEIEKKGNHLIFFIDNMEVTKVKEELLSNYFGFIVGRKNTLKVTEVSVEQLREED